MRELEAGDWRSVITSAVALLELEDLLAPRDFIMRLGHAWHAETALIGT